MSEADNPKNAISLPLTKAYIMRHTAAMTTSADHATHDKVCGAWNSIALWSRIERLINADTGAGKESVSKIFSDW